MAPRGKDKQFYSVHHLGYGSNLIYQLPLRCDSIFIPPHNPWAWGRSNRTKCIKKKKKKKNHIWTHLFDNHKLTATVTSDNFK